MQRNQRQKIHASLFFDHTLKKLQVNLRTLVEKIEKFQKSKFKNIRTRRTYTKKVSEVSTLMKYLGVKLVTCPTGIEAECFCVALFQAGLVDYVFSSDSDCFLYGASKLLKEVLVLGGVKFWLNLRLVEWIFAEPWAEILAKISVFHITDRTQFRLPARQIDMHSLPS